MPIPIPKPNENKEEFIRRCMVDPVMVEEYDQDQRLAICNSQWDNRDKELIMDNNVDKIYELLEIKINKSDDDKRLITAVGSKETIDRDGDIVIIDGINIRNYKKNPVVLWSHNTYNLPIGKATKVWKEDKKLMFKIQFAGGDESPIAPYIYKLYKGGYLKSFSIGFAPDWNKVEYEERKGKQVRIIKESELFEISAVNVPANTSAVIQSIDKAWDDGYIDGIELKKLQEMLDVKVEDKEDKDKIINDLQVRIKELELQLEELKEEELNVYEELYEEYKVLKNNDKDIIDELIDELK